MYFFFSRQVLESFWVPGSMISCFCFSCFFASLLYLVLFWTASLLSPLLCFCASVPFNFTIVHVLFFSHVFLLLYFLLLCFSAFCLLLPLCFFFSFALFSPVCILNETLKTLGETQRNPKEILIRTPDKKPYKNPKETLHETLKKP